MSNRPKPSAVIFAKDVRALARFYREVAAMAEVHGDDDHIVLDEPGFQMVIHGIPRRIAEAINITTPPEIRDETPIKICLPVSSIEHARATATALGGRIGPKAKEWSARGFRACDGHDPEGNVFQVRESAAGHPPGSNDRHRMSGGDPQFAAFDDPPEALARAVDAGLVEYNFSVAPLAEVRSLAAFATAASGEVVGGAVGRTWGLCCELLQLWVAPDDRNSGIGSTLLRMFEERGRSRGCKVFYLTTLSFQAPEFYRRAGYAVLAEISGYPNGIVKYLMKKSDA